MKKLSLLVVLGLLAAGLSACGLTKEKLGFTRTGPDETKVVKKQPLILPPEYSVRPKNVDIAEDIEEDEEKFCCFADRTAFAAANSSRQAF